MKENIYRSCLCQDVNEKMIGQTITLSGWVMNIRDHGGVLFLDLRDTSDVVQVVSNDDTLFLHLTKESVIRVHGVVRKRSAETYNPNIVSGAVELLIDTLDVLSPAKSGLPFDILYSDNVKEDIRLQYRYLDLRNPKMKAKLMLRHELLHYLRDTMYDKGFMEVQTPILTASSPEGARDFVVPSRRFKGKFYALPQAPQIYKQLLMVGGISKYFQIAPCFRDEDARKDRLLEFYQLDLEMSYVTEENVLQLGEELFYETFTHFSKRKVSPAPFKRLTYEEAMNQYGTDKPDLRNPLTIIDITDILKDTTFKPFSHAHIKAIKVPQIGVNSNSWFNDIVSYASSIGMPGIGYLTLQKDGSLKGPIAKFLTSTESENLIRDTKMVADDVLFFIANRQNKTALKYAGEIRDYLGRKAGLIHEDEYVFCIVKDFPMFVYDEEEKKLDFAHNPFSLPKEDSLNKEPLDMIAYQYDFVCNGYEMSSGALRNYHKDLLIHYFELVGYSKEEVEERFKALMNAFDYGVPPHGGMALGLDRILMLLLDEANLREVEAFPTSSSGMDYLMGSPSNLTKEQLKELGLKIEVKKNE